MTSEEINEKYFKWMCKTIGASNNYKRLLQMLNSVSFHYILDRDYNRECDGIDLRYRFADEFDIPFPMVASYLDTRPCSVLEMMVALSIRMESIMDDPSIGNRYDIWFWDMIKSLGLDNMFDFSFNEQYVRQALDRFLNREYESNGRGGLFTLYSYPNTDLKTVEIWYQAMWYLNEQGG